MLSCTILPIHACILLCAALINITISPKGANTLAPEANTIQKLTSLHICSLNYNAAVICKVAKV